MLRIELLFANCILLLFQHFTNQVKERAIQAVKDRNGTVDNDLDVKGEYTVEFGVFRGQTFRWMLENALGYVRWLVYSMQGETTTTTAAISQNKAAFKYYVESFPEGREVISIKKKENVGKQKRQESKQISTLGSNLLSGHMSESVVLAKVAKQGATSFKPTVTSKHREGPVAATAFYSNAILHVGDEELCSIVGKIESGFGFAGFCSFNELSNIQARHIEWHEYHIRINVPRSKTDIYREGNFVYIQKISGEFCPVAVLSRYMCADSIELDSPAPLFHPLVFHKRGSSCSLENGPLSYSRSREIFKEALTTLGYDAKIYRFLSLRSGGLTSGVQNCNSSVPERVLKLYEIWRTDTAKDVYVQESLRSVLAVYSYLGL